MNSREIFVEKIRSYQTLVYKNGRNSFPKKEYTKYKDEIISQLDGFIVIDDNRDLKVTLIFKNKNRVIGDLDNITKPIFDILQKNGNIVNDKQITDLNVKKRFNNEVSSIIIKIEDDIEV